MLFIICFLNDHTISSQDINENSIRLHEASYGAHVKGANFVI